MIFNVSMQVPGDNLAGTIHNLESRGFVVTECTPIDENSDLVSFRIEDDALDFESIDSEIEDIEAATGGRVCTCVDV